MKHITAIITISLFVLTLNTLSFADIFYVDAVSGSNDNSGTAEDDAWQTITHALNSASGTEENPALIYVAAGTYNMTLGESFPITMNDNIYLEGDDRETKEDGYCAMPGCFFRHQSNRVRRQRIQERGQRNWQHECP